MKFCNIISRKLSFLFFILFFHSQLFAQSTVGSPYSRFGIGDLQFGGFTKNAGMGGLALSLNSPYNVNFSNPASYANLGLTTFEASANANFYDLKNSTESGSIHRETFGYFALGLPLKYKKAGLSLGLLPYSKVGYSISNNLVNDVSDAESHKYEGSGGLNQFFVGIGWSPLKNFSVGGNASFVFGTINQVRRIEYPYNNYYSTKISEATIIHDFYYNFGLIKTFDSLQTAKSDSILILEKQKVKINDSLKVLKKVLNSVEKISARTTDSLALTSQKATLQESMNALRIQLIKNDSISRGVIRRKQKSDWSINIGATFSPAIGLSGSHSYLANTYTLVNNVETPKDTVLNIQDNKGKLVLPLGGGLGISVKESSKWLMGVDFSLQNWQKYSLFGEMDSLANSWRTSVGFQFIPDDRSIKSYFNLVQYRLGFHYEQTYLQLHDTQLNDMGVSLGLGFPMKKALTVIQFSIEAGRRGTISNNLVELNYVKCSLAFTLNDRWFIKPKFD